MQHRKRKRTTVITLSPVSLPSQKEPRELSRNTFFSLIWYFLCTWLIAAHSPGVPQWGLLCLLSQFPLLVLPSLLHISVSDFIKTLALFLKDFILPQGSKLHRNAGNPKCVSQIYSSFLSSNCLLDISTWMFYAYLTLNVFPISFNDTIIYSEKQIRIMTFISASFCPFMVYIVLPIPLFLKYTFIPPTSLSPGAPPYYKPLTSLNWTLARSRVYLLSLTFRSPMSFFSLNHFTVFSFIG